MLGNAWGTVAPSVHHHDAFTHCSSNKHSKSDFKFCHVDANILCFEHIPCSSRQQHFCTLSMCFTCHNPNSIVFMLLQAPWNVTLIAPNTSTVKFVTECLKSDQHVQHLPIQLKPWKLGVPTNYTAHHFMVTQALAPADITFRLQYSSDYQ